VINVPRTASRRRRREDNEEDEEEVASALVNPLVQSIRDFAKDEDRRQVALLQSQSKHRVFQRRAQLVDEARKYRRLMAELDPNDPRTKRLSDFYLKETLTRYIQYVQRTYVHTYCEHLLDRRATPKPATRPLYFRVNPKITKIA
jgi:hypothetical protein